ncbi:SDR family oxidoreductase [Accumulibacter sp.]|uniref:SDR family NAD(P)-dependent oxidoreductase n=1 Tax=Accumulibacter sp. TaxID=2053492 RepID=UPI001DE3E48D|nr:SDR family oxidoreductase [Accumulibacter sp.]MCB1967575.1 SDR family oxidoreductase [Accumulibacter sp.]MCP5229067.1 SDR family oxidoreductase [Accumulibacter sp.]
MTTSASFAPPTAVVTGAAGGIGEALVLAFHQAGYEVIASDVVARPCALPCTDYIQADLARVVADEAYADTIFRAIRGRLDGRGLDALINNAAIQILGGAESLTRVDWHRTLDVNLLAPFLFAQALLAQLEAARGCVLNISSIHARLTKKNFVAYATSKAALSGMTRALAVDLGPRVRVNAIEPAAIATKMLQEGFSGKPTSYRQLQDCHPLQRIGQATELAELALAIAGGGMDFLHGACVGLDGGIGARLFDPA